MKRFSLPMLVVFSLSFALLAGCSASQHQVVGMNQECMSCHSEKTVYDLDGEVPASAVEVGNTVTVSTDASSIVVASPTFTSEDGSSYVPVTVKSSSVSDGQATVQLEDGLWVLCVDEGDTARAVLVHASSSNSDDAVVEL